MNVTDVLTYIAGGLGQTTNEIYISSSPFTEVINNTFLLSSGIYFSSSYNSTAINNSFSDYSGDGVGLITASNSDNVLIQGNVINQTMALLGALYVTGSDNVTIKENVVQDNLIIFANIDNSDDLLFFNNTLRRFCI